MKVHSPSLKALENPRTVSFKRYFLGHFVDNSDIFVTALLVQEERILIPVSYFLFIVRYAHSLVIIVLVNFRSPCPPVCQLQLKLCRMSHWWRTQTEKMNENDECKAQAKSNNCFLPVSTATTVLLLWLCQLTVSCKSSINFQKIRFLFFKCHSPWTLRRFEIK